MYGIKVQKLYQDMESRIENAANMGRVPEEVHSKHKGFSQWDSYSSRSDHDTIIQVWHFLLSPFGLLTSYSDD